MAIEKKYSADKKNCRIAFTIPKEVGENFNEISLVGDFNSWDPDKNGFSKNNADGSFISEIELDAGKEYQFRYLCDGTTWLNEPDADKQEATSFGDSENSVIVI